jgi:hypothetical protein
MEIYHKNTEKNMRQFNSLAVMRGRQCSGQRSED